MRGRSSNQSSMLCLLSPEECVPADHPLRAIRTLSDEARFALEEVFDAMYADGGRPSVPPERLLKASLLIALYSIGSERQFCEQLQYNLLFRWFLDMDMLEPAFDASTFSKNRDRMMEHDVAAIFFATIRRQASDLMSREHFSVDGTLMENRHGLLMDLRVTEASGTAERETALEMLREHVGARATVGADKGHELDSAAPDFEGNGRLSSRLTSPPRPTSTFTTTRASPSSGRSRPTKSSTRSASSESGPSRCTGAAEFC